MSSANETLRVSFYKPRRLYYKYLYISLIPRDYIDTRSVELLPKESLILRGTSPYFTYYTNGEQRQLPVMALYLLLAQVVLYLSYR